MGSYWNGFFVGAWTIFFALLGIYIVLYIVSIALKGYVNGEVKRQLEDLWENR